MNLSKEQQEEFKSSFDIEFIENIDEDIFKFKEGIFLSKEDLDFISELKGFIDKSVILEYSTLEDNLNLSFKEWYIQNSK